jgi:hypothetical protein
VPPIRRPVAASTFFRAVGLQAAKRRRRRARDGGGAAAGAVAPDFSLPDQDGVVVSLADLAGQRQPVAQTLRQHVGPATVVEVMDGDVHRSRSGVADRQVMLDYMRGDRFELAAFLGVAVTFRSWDQQLRQPVLVSGPRMIASVSPSPKVW